MEAVDVLDIADEYGVSDIYASAFITGRRCRIQRLLKVFPRRGRDSTISIWAESSPAS